MTVVATSRAIPNRNKVILIPTVDGSGDQPQIWAREIGRGRHLYNATGLGQHQPMSRQGSLGPRLYWQNLR